MSSDPYVEPGAVDDVVEGERYAVSPLDGTVYVVTKWIEGPEEDQIRSVSKREATDEELEELPAEARSKIEERVEEVVDS